MLPRLTKVLLAAALLGCSVGCIEMTQIITLNPDGRGKIQYDIRMPAEIQPGANPGAKEKNLTEIKNEAALRTLTKHPDVTAWKDVSLQLLPDGRVHFKGTAYFDDIAQLTQKKSNDPFADQFELLREKDILVLKVSKNKQDDGKKKPVPDFAKMTEPELDDHVMRERVKYQSSKGILIAMFTDLKLKTIIRLPGEARELKGFKKENERTVYREVDGNKALAAIQKYMALDNVALKKNLKESKSAELLEHLLDVEAFAPGSLTIHKLGSAQFAYGKEVKDARDAYPALRMQFNISDKIKLPGD